MADFRTIALIFAICFFADFLYRVFNSGSETVESPPPLPENVNTDLSANAYSDKVEKFEKMEKVEEIADFNGPNFDDIEEDPPSEFQSNSPPPPNASKSVNSPHGNSGEKRSSVKVINILYCIS